MGMYEISISLTNSGGNNGPYKIKINIIDTPPEFEGFSVNSVIGEEEVRVRGPILLYRLPPIINIES